MQVSKPVLSSASLASFVSGAALIVTDSYEKEGYAMYAGQDDCKAMSHKCDSKNAVMSHKCDSKNAAISHKCSDKGMKFGDSNNFVYTLSGTYDRIAAGHVA